MSWKRKSNKRMRISNIFYVIPVLFIIIILILYFLGRFESITFSSFLYGFLIATLNFLLGIFSIKIGLHKSNQIFLIVVFGGIILRLFIILLLILLTLNFLFVSLNSFIFTTFILYFYYLTVEIYILIQKKDIKIKINNG